MNAFFYFTSLYVLRRGILMEHTKYKMTFTDSYNFFEKMFPKWFYNLEHWTYKNLIYHERENQINPDVSKDNYFLATMPKELEPEMNKARQKLNACLHEYLTKYVDYELPRTLLELHRVSTGPRESMFRMLEILQYFSYPNPVSPYLLLDENVQ